MMHDETAPSCAPFRLDHTNNLTASQQIGAEMDNRRKNWLKSYKEKPEINDILELRNP